MEFPFTSPLSKNNLSNRLINRGFQISKYVILSASSVGLRWMIERLWQGNRLQENKNTKNNQIMAVNRTGEVKSPPFLESWQETKPFPTKRSAQPTFFQSIGVTYPSQKIEWNSASNPLSCETKLSLGSSATSENLRPLIVDSTLCLPHGESTIPDEFFAIQTRNDLTVSNTKKMARVIFTGIGSGIGALVGLVGGNMETVGIGELAFGGAALGAMLGDSMSISFDSWIDKHFADDQIGRVLRRQVYLSQKKPAENIDMMISTASEILNELTDTRIEKTEHQMLLIKEYLTHIQKILKVQQDQERQLVLLKEYIYKLSKAQYDGSQQIENVLGKLEN